ncbi:MULTISPECIES: hypothetical protein [unclassified Sphingobium]|nr:MULTISPECIES: hypothetical protein [unclassified Sphingobium]MBG6118998.1 hypothetical protein [Sphingobium sp. JAI105]TWD20784.1 hypothetical protein FB594_13026 [Sphingobium sp. AEW001]PSO09932.1 hypothetical protein C7E20_19960 [Sphingobium sp. AEW4]TWC98164.1 hypothetical protein FB595_1298 [Sphingobium sp. AEW010]TWD18226.1 hypothetical protein FB596_1308 [Sphingobium sp. AEW013]
MWFFNSQSKREKEMAYAIQSIRNFLQDEGGKWDWDDFTSCSLRDPVLNSIRKKASLVDLPLDDEGRAILESLLVEVRALAE